MYRANNPRVNFREKEKKILDQILGQGKYDARIRPSGINGTGEFHFLRFFHVY
jgi:glutamate receptor, anionic